MHNDAMDVVMSPYVLLDTRLDNAATAVDAYDLTYPLNFLSDRRSMTTQNGSVDDEYVDVDEDQPDSNEPASPLPSSFEMERFIDGRFFEIPAAFRPRFEPIHWTAEAGDRRSIHRVQDDDDDGIEIDESEPAKKEAHSLDGGRLIGGDVRPTGYSQEVFITFAEPTRA